MAGQVLVPGAPELGGPDCALGNQNQNTGQLQPPEENEGWCEPERLVGPSSAGHTGPGHRDVPFVAAICPSLTGTCAGTYPSLESRAYSRTGADPHPGSRTWPGRRCGALDSQGLGVLSESSAPSAVLQAGWLSQLPPHSTSHPQPRPPNTPTPDPEVP